MTTEAPEAALPLTCQLCCHAAAMYLIILDAKWATGVAGSRRSHLACAPCAARNAGDARKIAASPASAWLFELRPVPEAAVRTQTEER